MKQQGIVSGQASIVNKTIEAFGNMNSGVEKLVTGLKGVGDSVSSMEEERRDTLHAIESISAASEETAASALVVTNSVQSQLSVENTEFFCKFIRQWNLEFFFLYFFIYVGSKNILP